MKHMKKLAAVLVSVLMSFAMMTIVFADNAVPTYTLTLKGTTDGHTYEAYQIFTGDLSTEGEKKVLSNVEWGTGITYKGTESAAEVAKALGDGKSMTIEQLEDKLTLTTPVKTVTSSKGSTVIGGLAAGYYLVKDQDDTQTGTKDAYTKFIVQIVGDTEANIKSDVPTVEKKVKDTNDSTGETSDWQDSADADINDDVQYQITGTMPNNIADYTTYKYVFTDTMSKGLTFKKGSTKIMIGTKNVTLSFTENATTNADGITVVTWTCDNLKGIDGVTLDENTNVVVTYTATLNESAVIGAGGNPNTVNLTYSNNPNKGGEGDTGKTPDDKNIVFTYKLVANKLDQDKNPLNGAGFTLYKNVKGADGKVTTEKIGDEVKGEAMHTFSWKGVDDGEYVLKETTTPAGYNTMKDITFTVSAEHDTDSADPKLRKLETQTLATKTDVENGTMTAEIVNKKGATLPSTGGVGTTMFYVAGGLMVVVAGVLLAAKKKAEAK